MKRYKWNTNEEAIEKDRLRQRNERNERESTKGNLSKKYVNDKMVLPYLAMSTIWLNNSVSEIIYHFAYKGAINL